MRYSVVVIVSLLQSNHSRLTVNGRVPTWVTSHPTGCYIRCCGSQWFWFKESDQKCLFYQAVVYQTTSKPLATQGDVEAAIAEVTITQP